MDSKETLRERWLVDDYRQREHVMAALFDSEYPRLRGLAYVLLADEHLAEEAAMETFVKAFSSWSRIRKLDWPAGYLRRILINQCRGKLRRRGLEQRVNRLFESGRSGEPTGWDAKRSDSKLDLWGAIQMLPDRQRTCVVLRYVEDMTDAEIASTLECSIGSVKTHMHRARKALSRTLQSDEGREPDDA